MLSSICKFKSVKKSLRPSELHNYDYVGIVEAKYDGSRYRIRKVGNQFDIFSKRISVVTNDYVNKTDNFPQFHCFKELDYDFDIEVEMVVGIGTHCKASHVTRVSGSNPDRAVRLQKEHGWLNAVLIDVHFYKDFAEGLEGFIVSELKEILNEQEGYSGATIIMPVQWHSAGYASLTEVYEEAVSLGYEGIMLKDDGWVKVKKVDTWDYVIEGFKESNSANYIKKGWIGSIIFGYVEPFESDRQSTCFMINDEVHECQSRRFIKNHIIVPCGTCGGFDHELRDAMSKNQSEYIGRVIEVEGQELDKKLGVRHPRFVRFRDDKNPLECTKESLLRRTCN